jgi:hypothetical protein
MAGYVSFEPSPAPNYAWSPTPFVAEVAPPRKRRQAALKEEEPDPFAISRFGVAVPKQYREIRRSVRRESHIQILN